MNHSSMQTADAEFQLISAEECLTYSTLKHQQLTIHRIDISTMQLNDLDYYYQKYGIVQPAQIKQSSLKRQCEFFIGRLATHYALNNLGEDPFFEIKKGKSGEPIWPKGITGSISHTMTNNHHGIAIAVASNTLLPIYQGIDIEAKQNMCALKDNPTIRNGFLTQQEQKVLLPYAQHIPTLDLILFSAKESIIKAIYQKHKKLIYFDAIHCLRICPQQQQFSFYIPQLSIDKTVKVQFIHLENEILTYTCL